MFPPDDAVQIDNVKLVKATLECENLSDIVEQIGEHPFVVRNRILGLRKLGVEFPQIFDDYKNRNLFR